MTQIEYVTGLLNKLNKKSISIITEQGLKKTIKNVVNLDILRKFNYRCQKIILIRLKVKGVIKHKIVYIGLSSREQFRYLLLDLLDNDLEVEKINIDNLYHELEQYIEGKNGVLQISESLSSESIFKIENYALFLEKINFKNKDKSIIDITDKIYTNILINYKIYRIPKCIPKLLAKIYGKKDENGILNTSSLNSNSLLYDTFVSIKDIQEVGYFYDFFTLKNKDNMLQFIYTIVDKSLEKSNAHKLKTIYKVLCNIIVYLKANIGETYILKERLINLCDISIFLDDVLEFMEKVNFIKVISNNNQKYVSLSSRYYEELSISKFLKIFNNNINNSSILIDSLSINATLNNKQLAFLENFNNNNISILIGKPGTGKSYISSLAINNMNTDKIAVLGPTGMAVKNIKKNIKKKVFLKIVRLFIVLSIVNQLI